MIKRGDKVQYIGNSSNAYLSVEKTIVSGQGKKGSVISDPYQLSAVPDSYFVDVEWFFEKSRDEGLNVRPINKGHVVNVKNLKVI